MTLIINEIHINAKKSDCYIVACADRRITYKDSTKKEMNKKLFRIEYLNACVSYWGNTRIKNNQGNYETLSSWLPNFIKKSSSITNLYDFSVLLRSALNKKMHTSDLRSWDSGFHLSGFNNDNNPEFFHFSNTNWQVEKGKYVNTSFAYREPYADFAERDYKSFFEGNKIDWTKLKAIGHQTYRNGDFTIHEAAWKKLDEAFDSIFGHNNFTFKRDRDDKNLYEYYKFKLKFIGDVYQRWGQTKNVGGPFDIVILRPRKVGSS